MPAEFAPLFSQETQFQAKSGRNNTGGWLRVFLAGTDDPAETYSDYSGTRNPERIVLDDNGRAVVICDSARAYRLEVYSADGALLWTEEPVYCSVSAGGGVAVTRIMSSDGSIAVDEDTAGSITTYDLSIAPSDSPEFIEWARCANPSITVTGVAFPAYVEGSMEVEAGAGLKVQDGLFYHVTSTFNVTPTGAGINYETLTVRLMVSAGGVTRAVASRSFDIDNSLSDPVNVEFSCDVVPAGDGYLFWYVVNAGAFAAVDAEMQVHRVYSGINAVPGTCATKQWVQDVFDADMSTKVDWSAIGYNQYGEINSIGSSAIAGGLDSATVSGIASAYAESAASSKADISSLTAYQPVSGMTAYQSAGDYALNSAVNLKLDASASSNFYTTANESGYAVSSDVASALGLKADSSALTAYQPVSGMTAYQPTGDYAYNSAVSSKLEESAFTGYSAGIAGELSGISGELSGKADSSALTAYQEVSGMTAYALSSDVDSGLSGKLDASASSQFITALPADMATTGDIEAAVSGKLDNSASSTWYPFDGNPSGFLTEHQELSGYVEKSAISAESAVWNGVTAKLDATASSQFITALPADMATTGDIEAAVSGKLDSSASSTWYPFDGNPSGFLTSHQSLAGYATEAYVDSSVSGKADSSALTAYQPTGDYAYNSAVSSKLDASASSDFYGTGNISGFVDSAYVDGQVSGKLDATASAGFYTTANESGYVDSAYVDSAVSGKQDTLTFDWDADSAISSINGSALAGGGSVFPVEIAYAGSLRAVITTGFQGDVASRPTLFISSNPLYQTYPRMMLSENTGHKSATFLSDAFEFYTGTGTRVWRADYAGIAATNQYALNASNVSGKQWALQPGVVSGGDTANTMKWWLNRNGVSGITGTATWKYTTAEYNQLTSMYDTVSANSASWAASGIQETALGWLEV